MKAMILAAGRGERMRPLTDTCPKPLLKVHEVPLIEHHIRKLVAAGINEIVINLAWLGDKIKEYLGNGSQFGAIISYSEEAQALETAGGIVNTLDKLAKQAQDCFLVVNADVFSNFDYQELPKLSKQCDGHLFLVANPEHNPTGDFTIENGLLKNLTPTEQCSYTFSGIAIYRRRFFQALQPLLRDNKPMPLAPMLRAAADKKIIAASLLNASWTDVGTPARLAQLNENGRK